MVTAHCCQILSGREQKGKGNVQSMERVCRESKEIIKISTAEENPHTLPWDGRETVNKTLATKGSNCENVNQSFADWTGMQLKGLLGPAAACGEFPLGQLQRGQCSWGTRGRKCISSRQQQNSTGLSVWYCVDRQTCKRALEACSKVPESKRI